jgi:hypothetical protein
MCTVFWDRRGVILLDVLEPDETVNSERYAQTLTKLKACISRVRPEKQTTFRLQHDNARPLPVWRPPHILQNWAGLSYHFHLIAPI